jgi:TRAP-type C4-dicarboxylate transport system substrate-binding protein
MRRVVARFLTLAALIAVSAGLGGCLGGDDSDKAGGEDEPDALVLTLANPGDAADLDEFVREVASQSDESMRIGLENGWREGEIDFERGTLEDVCDGRVDLGSVGARALDLVGVRSLRPLVAPFAVDSYALEREVLASPLAEEMLRGVEQADLVGIALLPGELRKPVGISRALVDTSDYRGATIGIRPSNLSAGTFEALGADTEGYLLDADVSSLDGLEAHLTAVAFAEYEGPTRTLAVNVNLWPRALVIVMNPDAYDALSADQREVLRAAGRASLDPAIEDLQAREREALGVLCSSGELAVRSATKPQLARLRAATAPVVQAVERSGHGREALSEIAAMRADVEPEQPLACPAEDSEPAGGGATPIDGLWQMETTRDEAAELVPAADLVAENWGEFLFAFRDGRFAFTTENGPACIWAYGRYTVDEDIVEWRIEDGGGEAPNDAANSPGEQFAFRWSQYRDQLALEPVAGAISPEPFRVEPWRRLDDEPSVDALSRRCPPPADALG